MFEVDFGQYLGVGTTETLPHHIFITYHYLFDKNRQFGRVGDLVGISRLEKCLLKLFFGNGVS